MALNQSEAMGIFSKQIGPAFNDKLEPKNFLRTMFKPITTSAKFISTEVKRSGEKIAADVQRGSQGNRNKFGKSTERIYYPPFYKEFFEVTELDHYDRVFGNTEYVNGSNLEMLVDEAAEKLAQLQWKIERRYELQCSQAIFDREVALVNGDNITFPKKAASEINPTTTSGAGGQYWDNAAALPATDLELACKFIRQSGKGRGGTLNALFSSDVWNALVESTQFTKRFNFNQVSLTEMVMSATNEMLGANTQGRIKVGPYILNCWTYPEYYDTDAGVSTPYIPAKKVAVMPLNPRFEFRYAGVPMLPAGMAQSNSGIYTMAEGEYHIRQYNDDRVATSFFEISSAGLAVPVAIDQIAIITALA